MNKRTQSKNIKRDNKLNFQAQEVQHGSIGHVLQVFCKLYLYCRTFKYYFAVFWRFVHGYFDIVAQLQIENHSLFSRRSCVST